MPNASPASILQLNWVSFGQGINNLIYQIKSYGKTLGIDACIGINDAGLIMATLINTANFERVKIGYLRHKSMREGRKIENSSSFLPKLKKNPNLMLFDFEIKSGGGLKTIVKKVKGQYESPKIYFTVFGALVKSNELKVKNLDNFPFYKNIRELGISDFFIATTIMRPGIEPPIDLR